MPELVGAYVSSEARYRFSATDSNGVRRERFQTFEIIGAGVDTAAQQADAAANAALLASDLGLVSEAEVTLVGLTHQFANNAFSGAVLGNVYARAILTCLNATAGKDKVTITFLAPKDSIVSGSNIIRTAADLNTFLNNFKDGNVDQTATISDGDAIVDDNAPVVVTGDRLKFESSGSSF